MKVRPAAASTPALPHARRLRRCTAVDPAPGRHRPRHRSRRCARPDLRSRGASSLSNGRTRTSRASRSTATARSSSPAPRSRSTPDLPCPRSPAGSSTRPGIQAILEEALAARRGRPRRDLNDMRYHEHRRRADHRDHGLRRRCGPDDPSLRAERADRTSRRDAGARSTRPRPVCRSSSTKLDRLRRLAPRRLARSRGHVRGLRRPPVRRGVPPKGDLPRSRCRGRSTTASSDFGTARPRSASIRCGVVEGADWDDGP